MSINQDIVIDQKIRDWVFFPIVIVMVLTGGKIVIQKVASKAEYQDVCDKHQLMRCQNLMKHGGLLNENSFNRRKYHLCKSNNQGYLVARSERPIPEKDGAAALPMNSNQMMDMLKGNISMAIPMIVLFNWVKYLFSGFIVARVPFPLTQKFRQMLQSGMNMMNLNVRYVSSLSLYFLVLTSLNQLITVFLKSDFEDDSEVRAKESLTRRLKPTAAGMPGMPNMGGMMGGMGGMMDPMSQMKGMFGGNEKTTGSSNAKFFQSEKENLEVQQYNNFLDDAEDLLLAKYKQMLKRD